MTFPESDFPDVSIAAHAVVAEAKAAGVWVFGGGFMGYDVTTIGIDGSIKNAPLYEGGAHIGGFCVVDVANKEEALKWAHKTAIACRCAQEVREFMPDDEANA